MQDVILDTRWNPGIVNVYADNPQTFRIRTAQNKGNQKVISEIMVTPVQAKQLLNAIQDMPPLMPTPVFPIPPISYVAQDATGLSISTSVSPDSAGSIFIDDTNATLWLLFGEKYRQQLAAKLRLLLYPASNPPPAPPANRIQRTLRPLFRFWSKYVWPT